jgi:hypothetical protein
VPLGVHFASKHIRPPFHIQNTTSSVTAPTSSNPPTTQSADLVSVTGLQTGTPNDDTVPQATATSDPVSLTPSTTQPARAQDSQIATSSVSAPSLLPSTPSATQSANHNSLTRLQTGTSGNAISQAPVSSLLPSTTSVTQPLNSQ